MSRSAIKVVARVRPSSENSVWVNVVDEHTLEMKNYRNMMEMISYNFERVYGEADGQQVIYTECVEPLLTHVLNGGNSSVFCYGPTGAGKTHTMQGSPSDPGIISRSVRGIFQSISESETFAYRVWFSYLEIYNEKVLDLMANNGVDLPIREDQKHNLFVTNLTEYEIPNVDVFNKRFGSVAANRTTASTKVNQTSSRSHSVLIIRVEAKETVEPFRIRKGKLYLTDLAGSEDNRRTGNEGIRLNESCAINRSLHALGQVVNALNCTQKVVVPYRHSKLTRLLQDSLGGSCMSCMVINIAPEEEYFFDTHTTLKFARKAKKVQNIVKINETSNPVIPVYQDLECTPTSLDSSPVQSAVPSSLLSPLIRKQTAFEQSIVDRIISLESTLAAKIQQKLEKSVVSQNSSCVPPDVVAHCGVDFHGSIDNTTAVKKTINSSETVTVIEKRHVTSRSVSQKLSADENINEKTEVANDSVVTQTLKNCRKSLQAIKDKHFQVVQCSGIEKNNAREKLTVFSDGSRVNSLQDVELSSSPMFRNEPVLKREKRKSISNENDPPVTKMSRLADEDLRKKLLTNQKAQNLRVIKILNEGSVQNLKDLQTIGPKKAKAIYDWRELHGQFHSVTDLKSIPGFGGKFVGKFLERNFIDEAVH